MSDSDAERLAEGEEDFEFLWQNDFGKETARYHLDCFAAESPTDISYPFGVRLAAAMRDQFGDPTVQMELGHAFHFRNDFLTKPNQHYPARKLASIAIEKFMMPVFHSQIHEKRCMELAEEAVVAIQTGQLPGINRPPYGATLRDFCLWMADKRQLQTAPWIAILFEYWKEIEAKPPSPQKYPPDRNEKTSAANEASRKLAFLTVKQRAVYDLIQEDTGQTGKQLLAALEALGTSMDQSTLTSSIIPALTKAGLVLNMRPGYIRIG